MVSRTAVASAAPRGRVWSARGPSNAPRRTPPSRSDSPAGWRRTRAPCRASAACAASSCRTRQRRGSESALCDVEADGGRGCHGRLPRSWWVHAPTLARRCRQREASMSLSRKASRRCAGRGCPAMPSATTRCGSSCTRSPTTSPTSCAPWRCPKEVEHWSLTTLREKLVKIGARIVRHGRYVVFQLAEVAVPRALFAEILRRIDRLRGSPVPAT